MTADCRIFEEKLPGYLEGAITGNERQEIEQHLEFCDRCRLVLQDLKKTGALLAGLEEKEPPPWFTQRVMTRVREEARTERGWLRKLFFPLPIKVPIEAMASLLIAVLAWYVYQTAPPEMKVLPETPSSNQIRQQETVAKETGKPLSAAAPPAPAGKLTAGGDLRSGPEDKAESRVSRAGEGKGREEMDMAARSAGVPAEEEKKAEVAAGLEAVRPSMAPLKKSGPSEAKPTPAPILQEAPRRMERGPQEKDESGRQKLDAVRDRAQVMGKAAVGLQPQVLTVRVQDVDQAGEAVHQLLQRINAENIREETQAGRKVISGVVGVDTFEVLTDQLKALGEVSPREYSAPTMSKVVLIRIEIVPALEGR